MTAAARLGEQFARSREQQAHQAQAHSEQAAREHRERVNAEREAARASLARVHQPQWWDSARAEDVTNAYATAKAWSGLDPEAVRAEQRIAEQVHARYGLDITRASDPAEVSAAMGRADEARAGAGEQRMATGGDRAEAAAVMATAEVTDRAAETHAQDLGHGPVDVAEPLADSGSVLPQVAAEQDRAEDLRGEAGIAYDSAARREAMAQGLDHIENRGAVEARVRSDVAQGRPPTEAVTSAPGASNAPWAGAGASPSSPEAPATAGADENAFAMGGVAAHATSSHCPGHAGRRRQSGPPKTRLVDQGADLPPGLLGVVVLAEGHEGVAFEVQAFGCYPVVTGLRAQGNHLIEQVECDVRLATLDQEPSVVRQRGFEAYHVAQASSQRLGLRE